MSLITPLSLLLGLLAVPIVLLYMLRLRRREVSISSIMLWRRLLRDREANAPWQRIRRNLLLIIQLIILALLVFALARPYVAVSSIATGSIVVLLDGSASMLTQEGDTERFDLARREVERLINDLPGDSQMTLILVGSNPRVLVSGGQDPDVLHEALAQAQASAVEADWPAAMALAAGAAQGYQDGRVVLVSDGGLPAELPPMPLEVILLPVGSAEENLAVTALSSRNSPSGLQVFAAVTNFGQLSQEALINLSLDGELFDARRLTIAGGETTNLTWTVPDGTEVIDAALTGNSQDYLSVDDRAWTIFQGGGGSRVLLLTSGNHFLETVLSVLPGVEVFMADPEAAPEGVEMDQFDLIVADSVTVPENVPDVDMLIVNPSGTLATPGGQAPMIRTGTVFTDTEVIRLENSPLLRFVDWGAVNVREARQVDAAWARPLVQAEGGPLLMAGEHEGRRVVILTFSLQDSDLPLQIAFPIVMANIMSWLNPGGSPLAAPAYAPGEPVRIGVDSGAESIVVRAPDGVLWTQEAGENGLIFSETSQLGVYEITARNVDGERPAGRFAVNLISAAESAIAPITSVQAGSGTSATSTQGSDGPDKVGQRELWSWFAGLALSVLMVEWWIYHRGARLPSRDDWSGLTSRRNG